MTATVLPRAVEPAGFTKSIREPILPLPKTLHLDEAKVALGEKLFNETSLSHNNTISCASCHAFSTGGTDRLVHSKGIEGQEGRINAPTVFNSAYNFKQFWDGRADDLNGQIDGPTHDPVEMGSSWEEIVGKLNASADYLAAFGAIYPDGIRAENIRDAIAVFESSLVTPNAKFDRFLEGDQNAITADELEGYRIFKSVGCSSCHQGMNVGGNLFQEFGVMGDYFKNRGNPTEADNGRFNVTRDKADMHVFKVPSLRNVALTSPYFHDGSVKYLDQAVIVMSKYQLGKQLSEDEVRLVVLFLESLTGEYTRYGEK